MIKYNYFIKSWLITNEIKTCLTDFPSTNIVTCKSIAYVVFHTTAFTRTTERTVYMILNLSWFFFLTLERSTSLWKQFLQLCFQPAKNVLYISLDCYSPDSIVAIILFSALYLCPELITLKKQTNNKDPIVERQKEGKERGREGGKKKERERERERGRKPIWRNNGWRLS